MPTVWIPSLLRDLAGGREKVDVSGSNVGEVIEALDRACPGIKDRLCLAGRLRPGIAVAVDNQFARLGLGQPVSEASEIQILPAISGGSIVK
jgi:molybdopterin converting factor small subunit